MQEAKASNVNYIYTHHGAKRNQGRLCIVEGKIALGYFEKGRLVGYTYLEELMNEACTRKLIEYSPEF